MTEPPKKSLSDWLVTLAHLHTSSIDLGLSRILPCAKALSLLSFSCPVVMVAGTNGKGSTVRLLESFYLAAGYRVAAYTSPHLIHFNERLRLQGEMVSDERLVEAFECIDRVRGDQGLSFFEFTTLACLWICQQAPLDVLLLEVGLGGRLDAVNVVEPDISVITSIGIDHVEWLGDNREAIGREKAGIFREARPVVCGDVSPPKTVLQRALDLSSPFYCLGKDFHVSQIGDKWVWESDAKRYLNLPQPTLKLENAATALMVADLLQPRLPLTQFALLKGLKTAHLPGRFEQVNTPVKIIFDVAHNASSAAYLAEQLQAAPVLGSTFMVLAMLKDKAVQPTVDPLLPLADAWYVGGLTVPRGASCVEIMTQLAASPLKNCYNFDSVAEALRAALERASPMDRVVVLGSFHTVAEAKTELLTYLSRKHSHEKTD